MSEHTYERSNYDNGSVKRESWLKDGNRHRDDDKPARITYCKDGSVFSKHWFKDGKGHRDNDKPAEIDYRLDGSVYSESWYTDGARYTPQKTSLTKLN